MVPWSMTRRYRQLASMSSGLETVCCCWRSNHAIRLIFPLSDQVRSLEPRICLIEWGSYFIILIFSLCPLEMHHSWTHLHDTSRWLINGVSRVSKMHWSQLCSPNEGTYVTVITIWKCLIGADLPPCFHLAPSQGLGRLWITTTVRHRWTCNWLLFSISRTKHYCQLPR